MLQIWHLLILQFAIGIFTVFFDVAYQSYLPALVQREHLIEGNSKLQLTVSVAQVAGPSMAGGLIAAITAPYAIVVDAVSFVVSTVFMVRMRHREELPEQAPGTERPRMWPQVKEGLHWVVGNRQLRAIAGCTGTSNFFGTSLFAIAILYFVRSLHLSAIEVGAVFAVGSVGSIAGALLANRMQKKLGVGRSIVANAVLFSSAGIAYPLAPHSFPLPVLMAGQLVFGFAGVTYNITQVSLRQAITPERLQGRMNAAMRWIVWGTIPLGLLMGGAIGQWIGLRTALWVGATGSLPTFLWVLLSPVRSIREMPESLLEPTPAQAELEGGLVEGTPLPGRPPPMPELPEMEAWRRALNDPVSAFPIAKAGPAHIATLKTFDPPLPALEGRRLRGAERRGKRLLFPTEDGELVLLVHLMTAGRLKTLRAGENGPKTPAFALEFAGGSKLVLTENAKRKRAGVWLLTPEAAEEELEHLGPEALGLDAAELGEILRRESRRLHSLLRDQRAIAGIGRAWANEILHAAKLSPYALSTDLSDEEVERLATAMNEELARGLELRERGAGRHDLSRPQKARRAVPRLRHAARPGRLRGAHDLLLPEVPDRRPRPQGSAAFAPASVAISSSAMDTVADLMVKDVLTVDPSDSIGEAAEKMNAANVGAVVVVEDMVRIVGIVTERDLMRAVAARARAAEARVRQWMTPDPVTIAPDVSIDEAAKIMFENNFRHLPVVKDGRPLGIVSLRLLSRWAFESVQSPH